MSADISHLEADSARPVTADQSEVDLDTSSASSGRPTNRSNTLDNYPVHDDFDRAGEREALLQSDPDNEYVSSGHFLAAVNNDRSTTSNETLIQMVKGNLGTGILAIPDAFHHSGLFVGTLLLPILGMICVHCMHLLVRTTDKVKHRILSETGAHDTDKITYGKVGETAFRFGPGCAAHMANTVRNTINVFLVVTQIGFCCVYIVFMSANIKNLMDTAYPEVDLDIKYYSMMVGVSVLPIAMIKTLKNLNYPAMISNCCVMLGLILVMTYLLQDLPSVHDRDMYKPANQLPLFLSTSIYAFEGIGVVLPLQRNMRNPKDLSGWNGVVNTAMTFVTCLYIGLGFYGYLKYGDLVMGSITLNLPQTEFVAMSITGLFVMAIYLTYGLMLYVPVKLIEPTVEGMFSSYKGIHKCLLRASFVLLTTVLAMLVPHIDLFISLVGALASSTLALIFPPLMHSMVFWDTIKRWELAKNVAICLFGLFSFVTGTTFSMSAIVNRYHIDHS